MSRNSKGEPAGGGEKMEQFWSLPDVLIDGPSLARLLKFSSSINAVSL